MGSSSKTGFNSHIIKSYEQDISFNIVLPNLGKGIVSSINLSIPYYFVIHFFNITKAKGEYGNKKIVKNNELY